VSGRDQIPRHPGAHPAESDESESHELSVS